MFFNSRASVTTPSLSSPPPNLSNHLLDDIKLCETLYSEDRIGEAYALLENIHQFMETVEENIKENANKYIESSPSLKKLEIEGKDFMKELRHLTDSSHWNLWNSNIGPRQDVSVYTHRLESKGIYQFKLAGEIQRPLNEVLPALLENGLYQYWAPMCSGSEILQSPSAYRRIVKNDFNFILFQKSSVCNARADILPDGSAVLTLKPILSSDSNSNLLSRRPDLRMNLWGTIYLYEEEKTEEVEEEEDDDHLQIKGIKNVNSNEFSFSNVYEDKEEKVNGGWDDSDPSNDVKRLNTMSADLENIYSLSFNPPVENRKKKVKKTVVKVQAMFKADMLSEIIQDWIFNLAVRSAISMFIPMLEHQASMFRRGNGVHFNVIEKNVKFYDDIEEKIRDHQKKSKEHK